MLCAGCGGRGGGTWWGQHNGLLLLWSHCHSWTLGFPFLSITLPLGDTNVKIYGR